MNVSFLFLIIMFVCCNNYIDLIGMPDTGNVAAVAGGAAGGIVIVLLIILVVIVLLVVLRGKRKG